MGKFVGEAWIEMLRHFKWFKIENLEMRSFISGWRCLPLYRVRMLQILDLDDRVRLGKRNINSFNHLQIIVICAVSKMIAV